MKTQEKTISELFINKPKEDRLLIEQFDGFFQLEDITPDVLKHFYKSSTVDLFNAKEAFVGEAFIGDIHTADAGSLWKVFVLDFAGVSFNDQFIEINSILPDDFDSLEFSITYKGKKTSR